MKGQTKAWLIGWVRDGREEGHGCHGVGGGRVRRGRLQGRRWVL